MEIYNTKELQKFAEEKQPLNKAKRTTFKVVCSQYRLHNISTDYIILSIQPTTSYTVGATSDHYGEPISQRLEHWLIT